MAFKTRDLTAQALPSGVWCPPCSSITESSCPSPTCSTLSYTPTTTDTEFSGDSLVELQRRLKQALQLAA
jgi:hypothetical protein